MEKDTSIGFELFFAAIGIAIVLAFSVFGWYNESATYNRLTGAHTTWWDAVWVELRVQDNTIKGK